MPYTPITNLSRRGEKVAPFLSIQNIFGIALCGAPTFLIARSLPDLMRFVLVALAAIGGYLVTLDMAEMSLAERLIWRARGQIRMMRSPVINPDDLPGVVLARPSIPSAPQDSPFQMLSSSPLPAPRARAALDARASSAIQQVQLRLATTAPAPDHDGAELEAAADAEPIAA
ncbi:hypothetical protein K2Z83_25870 [Oscillochloris sp. ZM17-4]|uniref:hypothetical protein n=1 Tax=Oscillochloris sp. ZM17-4 TaxID=2866714 RepID=UPI001C73C2FA|nr:hypothetical protein [Oscillochloris sp. ZM17-4]MBX0331084.1 hypothetical protein [Oscillochloris sp. ZM17-4]